MKYIVTKIPSTYTKHRWSLKDSKDGVIYSSFDDALVACKKIGGAGVAELSQ